MEILILTPKGETVKMSTWKTESVIDLKKRISERLFMAPDLQRVLFFHGRVLDDENSLGQFAIEDKSVITLVEGLRGSGIRILANTIDGRSTEIEIDEKETVLNLKKKLKEKLFIDPDLQKLVYEGCVLDDEKKLEDYDIEEGSVINLIARLRGWITIFVRTIDGRTIEIETHPTDTVLSLKREIEEKHDLDLDPGDYTQKLIYNGATLSDDKRLEDYSIKERSVIFLRMRWKCGPIIWVKTIDGRTFSPENARSDTVLDLKRDIEQKLYIAYDDQHLIYAGEILKDEKKLIDYPLSYGSVIYVVHRMRDYESGLVVASDGKCVTVDYNGKGTVLNLKKKIYMKLWISLDRQVLHFEGVILDDEEKNLDDYGIGDKSVIKVTEAARKRIFIRTPDGGTFKQEIGGTRIIRDLKKRIASRLSLTMEELNLMFQDIVLEDDLMVDKLNILEGSVIFVNIIKRRIYFEKDGKEIFLPVGMEEKVSDIKRKICERAESSSTDVQLCYKGGRRLEDDKTLLDYKIEDTSKIRVLFLW